MKINKIRGREILDSNGLPTLEAEVTLENGVIALGQAPAGVSIGENEAVELRDGDENRFFGKGVLKAVNNVQTTIFSLLNGKEADDQEKIDKLMIEADGTSNKSGLGANAILAVSMAVCRAAARSQKIPLYEYIGKLLDDSTYGFPTPLVLVVEGGKHGAWATDCQEFFVIPKKEAFCDFREKLRAGAEIFYFLGQVLRENGHAFGVGVEGGYCPPTFKTDEEAFRLMTLATEKAGYRLGDQIVFGVDVAAASFFEKGRFLSRNGNLSLSSEEWRERLAGWAERYPIHLIEDPFGQDSWKDWATFNQLVGEKMIVVGDDLVTTNIGRIKKAIDTNAVGGVVIKLNQIGSVSETLKAIQLCRLEGLKTVISHRGGETNDDFIADLAVGSFSDYCKFGGPDRGERVAKYNRLLRIEEKILRQDQELSGFGRG